MYFDLYQTVIARRILRLFVELFALSEKGKKMQYDARAIRRCIFLKGNTQAGFESAGEKMGKYNKFFGKLEALLNMVGEEKGLENILRKQSKLEVNIVYLELCEILNRYNERFSRSGVMVLRNIRGEVRDIVFPVNCEGSEEWAYDDLKKALSRRTTVSGKVTLSEINLNRPLSSTIAGCDEYKMNVSLRNTLEYRKTDSKKLPKTFCCNQLTARDLFCFMTQYLDLFIEDWFAFGEATLPIAYGTLTGQFDGRCIVRPVADLKFGIQDGVLPEYYGPWLCI